MAKQQRVMRVEQRGQMAAMQQLESKSDEELQAETRYKAAAQAILGYRAAERYDAKAARALDTIKSIRLGSEFMPCLCGVLLHLVSYRSVLLHVYKRQNRKSGWQSNLAR